MFIFQNMIFFLFSKIYYEIDFILWNFFNVKNNFINKLWIKIYIKQFINKLYFFSVVATLFSNLKFPLNNNFKDLKISKTNNFFYNVND